MTQRVALVTGGAVRLGRAIATGLSRVGYDLLVTYHSSASEAASLASEVEERGRRCVAVRADLSEPEAAATVIDEVGSRFGRLDLLVNSAASFDDTPLGDVDARAWDGSMALNARAPHLLVRAAADLLRASRGSVVNLVDLSALQPWARYGAHSVSKAALAHLTRVQARTLAPEVRVNAIAPGAVLPPDDWSEARWQALGRLAALGRVGSPDDIVQAVLFFAEAGFVTGQILAIDGGRLLGASDPPDEE